MLIRQIELIDTLAATRGMNSTWNHNNVQESFSVFCCVGTIIWQFGPAALDVTA